MHHQTQPTGFNGLFKPSGATFRQANGSFFSNIDPSSIKKNNALFAKVNPRLHAKPKFLIDTKLDSLSLHQQRTAISSTQTPSQNHYNQRANSINTTGGRNSLAGESLLVSGGGQPPNSFAKKYKLYRESVVR